MARKSPPIDPRSTLSDDWAELCHPTPYEKEGAKNNVGPQAQRGTVSTNWCRRNASTVIRWMALIVAWLFGVTAEATRAAIVQTLKYLMITAALTAVTSGSFFAFIQYDLFEIVGKMTQKNQVLQNNPDLIEKEMIKTQTPPSTPSDIETSLPKQPQLQGAPRVKPTKLPPPPPDWTTEVFRTPSY